MARQLAERNHLQKRIEVLSGASTYEDLPWKSLERDANATPDAAALGALSAFGGLIGSGAAASAGGGASSFDKFDSVLTEEWSDDLLGDGD